MNEAPHLQIRCHALLGGLRLVAEFAVSAPWTVLFGPSGSGKSSLLRVAAGLWSPADSAVLLDGKDISRVPAHRRRIGLVAQKAALFPHRTVLGNVRFGSPQGSAGEKASDAALNLLDIGHLRHAATRTLSGGEYQRVALARALASQPRLLLLDEVFTGMHGVQRNQLLVRLREHCAYVRLPVVSVTHNVLEACAGNGDVIRLEAGTVVAQGKAADVLAAEREALRTALRK